MKRRNLLVSMMIAALALASGCGTGALKGEKRDGNYLVIADLDAVSVAQVGYKGVPPTVRRFANRDWGIDATVGAGIEQVVAGRVQGNARYVDDAELTSRLSYEKILVMRGLDADDVEFIRQKYAADAFDYLILVTKTRLGMSELQGAGMRQKDIPMADFRCQFFAAMQLDVFELATGRIVSTVSESQRENCPVDRYFDDIEQIDARAQADIRDHVVRVSAQTANKIARHLLMRDDEEDEFRLRLPGFE